MAKVFTAEPIKTTGRVANLIKDKPPVEKAVIKAQELSNVVLTDFSLNGFDVKVKHGPSFNGKLLEVWVEANYQGKVISINNPLQYYNPPILVPDGTFHKVTAKDGSQVDRHNYKEDSIEALKQIIVETLRIVAQWQR